MMKEYQIEDIKEFMNDLLVKDRYDSFYLYEARVKTALDYYIGGKINKSFFDTDELEGIKEQEYVTWKEIRHSVYDVIRGKRLPISFKIILMFNRENIERLVMMNNLPLSPEDIGALFFNINYANEALTVTTGTSIKVFTMDKTLENTWDDTVEKYYI